MKRAVIQSGVSFILFLALLPLAHADHDVMSVSQDGEKSIWSVTDAQAQAQARWDMFATPPPVPLAVILQKAEAKIRSSYGEGDWKLNRVRLSRFGRDNWVYVVTYVSASVNEKEARSKKNQVVAVLLPDGTVIDPLHG